ncbi:hypothetical protein RHMOL_Rhmol07G0235900 [Rhododendron molle]|uniref:Uncharacterized protein n=1 Tax=Rhododendron molle TaxID=49168 RepID=A0ACC0N5L8_RHOML|nr:hypothetical protein RHMOL_Rhmol07G0235900 [Rhododendron molle]
MILRGFLKKLLKTGQDEGIVVKDLGSKWEPSDRSGKWLKLKPDYIRAGSDLDVLIIGLLTKKFIKLIKEASDGTLDLDYMDVSGVTNIGPNTIDIDNDIEIDDDPILGNNEEDEPKKTREKAKNSSFVWDHFTRLPKKVPPPGYKQKATCNYCGTEFGCNSDHNGTLSMRTHLIIRYVPTRWNSTFFMLERAVIYQKAFERLEKEDSLNVVIGVREDVIGVVDNDNAIENVLEGEIIGRSERGREKGSRRGKELGTPTSEDWNVVQMYVEVLRTFYIVTERLSGSLYVTCNTFYKEVTTVKNAIGKLELNDDPKLLLLAKGMHLKFDKY